MFPFYSWFSHREILDGYSVFDILQVIHIMGYNSYWYWVFTCVLSHLQSLTMHKCNLCDKYLFKCFLHLYSVCCYYCYIFFSIKLYNIDTHHVLFIFILCTLCILYYVCVFVYLFSTITYYLYIWLNWLQFLSAT